MSSIGGKTRTINEGSGSKKVGLFEAEIVAINPTLEQFKSILGMDIAEDSKTAEYLGESKDNNTTLRVDIWLKEVKNNTFFKTSFFLENTIRKNKDATKTQFINNIGVCSWAEDESTLPAWFKGRDFRPAYVGEEDLYNFLRLWLGKLDYKDAETVLSLEWKKLMKGNVSDLKEQINGEYSVSIGALATVITRDKEGEIKTYQGVYNRAFIPAYSLKHFKLVNYNNAEELAKLKSKSTSELKPHEKFVLNVVGDYGCKDYFNFNELEEYSEASNPAAGDNTLIEDNDASY